MQVKIKKLTENAIIPEYKTEGAACFDLCTNEDKMLLSKAAVVVGTGLSFEIPKGYVMLVFSRSGHGFNDGLRLVNSVGVIDSDYRGEVKIGLHNDGDELFYVGEGERMAQGMVLPIEQVSFLEVKELTETARGEGGFGSTDNASIS